MESRKVVRECSKCSLASANAFCNGHRDLLDRIDRAGPTFIFRRKATVFVEGQMPRGVFILCAGRAKLSTSSSSGKTIITRISEAGDALGLNAVVSGRAYSVTAEMMESGQAKFISRDAFLELMKKHRQIAVAVAEHLSRRYYPVHEVIRTLGLGTHPAERLAKFLLSWTDVPARDSHETCSEPFNLSLTHQEIADSIGATRETVSKLFSELRKRHLLESKGTALAITNRLELESMVQF
jgi:CRP/FNR family transcriptional regulator, cyclic AMP receptor protein